jgi:hypothetical protein
MTFEDAALRPRALRPRALKPTTNVAVLATIAISAFSFVYPLMVVLSTRLRNALPNGSEITEATSPTALLSFILNGLVAVLLLVDFILAATAFLIWIYRVANHIHATALELSVPEPQDCVASWFIPLINLIRPYRVVKALYRSVGPHQGPTPRHQPDRIPTIITIWWSAWLTAAATSKAADHLCSTNDAGMITVGTWLDAVASLAYFIAAAGILAVLWRVEERLKARVRASTSTVVPQPTGVLYGSLPLAPVVGQ